MSERKVQIVGAGFSGLMMAYFLVKRGFQVEVFERSARAGGLIGTRVVPEGLVENAANGFLGSELIERVGEEIGVKLLPAEKSSKARYIFRGRARRWPLTIVESLRLAFKFLWAGHSRAPLPGETISAWGKRILGPAGRDYLLAPALQGIYAGEPERLSASLILSIFFNRGRKKKRRTGLVAPKDGMGAFMEGLETLLVKKRVQFHYDSNFKLGSGPVVICTPPHAAAQFLLDQEPELARELLRVEMVPLTTATSFYTTNAARLPGFGCLFPRLEKVQALGVLFNSSIFAGRASGHSETWIYRGVNLPNLAERIAADRQTLYGGIDTPIALYKQEWPEALPHYTLDLEKFLKSDLIARAEKREIYLMGNYLGALGLSRIAERAKDLAERL